MSCFNCGHFRNKHEIDDLSHTEPCYFNDCNCKDYDSTKFKATCMPCGKPFDDQKKYEQHKLASWNNGRCA